MARIMDTAFLRDNSENVYTNEALVLALLFNAKGKRNTNAEREVAKMLDDQNEKPGW